MDTSAARIRLLGETLADPDASPGRRRDAAWELFEVLASLVGLDDRDPAEIDLADTWVDGGRAIAPREAARCLREYARSSAFMRGVQGAIEAARVRFPGEIVHVLYAGTGPFATLVLPLAHRWAADEVRYTLLDIHQRSLDAAACLANHLGVADRIDAYVCADAADWRLEPGPSPQLLVVETMQQGLRDETQVAVCRNLVPQLRAGGLLVPQRIDLSIAFAASARALGDVTADPPPLDLGVAMSLTAENAAQGGQCNEIVWPDVQARARIPWLRTHITVFGDIVLGDSACSLNLPMRLTPPSMPRPGRMTAPVTNAEQNAGVRLVCRYEFTPRPGLHMDWQGATPSVEPMPAEDIGALKLPLSFPAAPLQAELAALTDRAWQDHPNRADYAGAWRSLALRSLDGTEVDGRTCSEHPDDFHDTPVLRRSPAMAALLRALPGRVTSARLLSLAEGAVIHEHRDRGTHLWEGLVRLHVPIRTHAGVDFRVSGERVTMASGECWYLNANFPHAVRNDGPGERVHLVADCAVDAGWIDWFVACGHPRRLPRTFDDPSITVDNVAEVIAQFEMLGSDASLQLAQTLRRQAAEAGIAVS